MNINKNIENSIFTVSLDPVVFTIHENKLMMLLVNQEFDNVKKWMIPGGLFKQDDLTLENGLMRILETKTGCKANYFEQLFSRTGHDTRSPTVSISYMALINHTDALKENAKWFSIEQVNKLELNFDHKEIFKMAISRLTSKVNYSTLPMYLLDNKFTLPDLQKVYEVILDTKLDKSSFRKRIMSSNVLVDTQESQHNGSCRPSVLYSLKNEEVYNFQNNIK